MNIESYDLQYIVYTDLDVKHTALFDSRLEALDFARFLVEDMDVDISHICIVKHTFYKLNS